MRTVKLTPKASEDLENIWHYGWLYFGEIQADRYINHLSEIFSIMSA
ncbi:type II toxin-antitoxin system RelE/ParE family toxin, partial [Salmonella enterica]|nr:type II toxin-antitoxin system RelE/ParE family toxin [Salmonella enterica]